MASAEVGRAVATLATAFLVDCRRPASWIALLAAFAAGWGLSAGAGIARVTAGIACGGLLAVAAIGRPPRGVPGGDRGRWAASVWLRAGWAAIGFLLTAAVGAGRETSEPMFCGLAAAAAVATAAFAASPPGGRRAPAADASLSLIAIGVAAVAAAVATAATAGPLIETAVAAVAWGLFVASLTFDPATASRDWLGGTANSRRHWTGESVPGIPMATALVAMAVCFFLAPQFAWAYAVLAMGWLVCLSVPLLADSATAAASDRLTRSAAGRPLTPGSFGRTAATAVKTATVLAWPAAVAAVLTRIGVWPGGGPLLALAWLAGGVAVVLAVAASLGRRGETAQALVLGLAATAVVWASRSSGGFQFWLQGD